MVIGDSTLSCVRIPQPAPHPIYLYAQMSRRLPWFVVNFDETPYFS
jgi:hypothetical protein